MLLDQKQRVIRSVILSTGTIESSVSHPRDVFRVAMLARPRSWWRFTITRRAIRRRASPDRLMTRRLFEAGEVIGIALMDHIILGGGGTFFSFRAEGLD